MLTIFTTTKPFRGHIGIIQTNAIRSWLLLQPACEVILLGDEEGTAEFALELGTRYIADVECNEFGTPLVNSMFSLAQDAASHQLMCYVNTDIILMSDFLPAISRIKIPSFLLAGRRWDIDLEKPLDFNSPDWEAQLRQRLAEAGSLHGISGIDYFVFPRGLYDDIPPFANGRPGWDNWMIYKARSLKVPVINATEVITAVHQNHDYSHHPEGKAGVWEGEEKKRNIELMGGVDHAFSLEYATRVLVSQGMKRALSIRHLCFRMYSVPVLVPRLHFLYPLLKGLMKLIGFITSALRR